MNFRSEIVIPRHAQGLNHQSRIISIGSCFADRMGQRLLNNKFKVLHNPFGTVFHPLPIIGPMRAALDGRKVLAKDLFFHEEKWRSLAFHSKMSHSQRDFLSQMIEDGLQVLGEALRNADLLILTFGTALGFRHLESNQIVANCHRLPQSHFNKEVSRLVVLKEAMDNFLHQLFLQNPSIKVLLTLSPVRHLRNGIVENAGAKAVLRTLCQELIEEHEQVDYFPSWEIMMDDLRDYRFYAPDMAHPSVVAEDYIWEKFVDAWIKPESQAIMTQLDHISKQLAHRQHGPATAARKQMLMKLRKEIVAAGAFVDLDLELAQVEDELGQAWPED